MDDIGSIHKITKLYEDRISGTISEQTFIRLIQDSESERNAANAKQLELLERQVENEAADINISDWMVLIARHSSIKDIDRELLDDLIDRIEIGRVKNNGRVQEQDVKIYYKMVGII